MARVTTRDRNKGKTYKDGSIKPPNWEYRFPIAPINGKRQNASKAGFKTQKEAQEAGTQAMAEYLGTGHALKIKSISFADLLTIWIEQSIQVNLKFTTVDKYKYVIQKHILPTLGKKYIRDITPLDITKFLNSLLELDLSNSYISQTHQIIKKSLDYAIEPCQYLKTNPARLVKTPRHAIEQKKNKVISKAEFKAMTEYFPPESKYYIALMLGYHAGLRIGEVFGLTWDNIDFEKKTLTVNKQMQRAIRNRLTFWTLGSLKTKSSYRTIALGDTLLNALKAEKLKQQKDRLQYGEYYKRYTLKPYLKGVDEIVLNQEDSSNLDFVCKKEGGELMTVFTLRHAEQKIKKALEIPFNFHSLRHTHATILVEAGANVKGVQERLGHEKIETTLQLYSHFTEKITKETVNIFEEAIND